MFFENAEAVRKTINKKKKTSGVSGGTSTTSTVAVAYKQCELDTGAVIYLEPTQSFAFPE